MKNKLYENYGLTHERLFECQRSTVRTFIEKI